MESRLLRQGAIVNSSRCNGSLYLGGKPMSVLFQLALAALVAVSFIMVVAVPVAYASPKNWEQSKRLLFLGSGLWVILVLLVGGLNYFVV